MGSSLRDPRALVACALCGLLAAIPAPPAAGDDSPAQPPDPGALACQPEQLACALGEGASARDARLARLAASIEAAASRAGEAPEHAQLAELLRRVEPARGPLERRLDELRRIAARLLRARGPAAPAGSQARLEAVHLRWPVGPTSSGTQTAPERAFLRGCGPSLLLDEAWISNDRRSIALCPGFVLLELDRAHGSPQATADAASFLLAHELGHVIEDTADDPEAERAADAWARAILAEHVGARVTAGDEPGKLLARALSSFCDLPPGDPLHGDGAERAALAARAVAPLVCSSDTREVSAAGAGPS